jgi:hypothetical protein
VELIDHLGSFASLLSLPAAVIATVAALRSPGVRRNLILCIAGLLALTAYILDVGDRLGWIKLSETGELSLGWGKEDGSNSFFFMMVNSRKLVGYKSDLKMMMILEIPHADTDARTDPAIEKSALYTITGDTVLLAIPAPAFHLHPVPPANSKAGDTFSVLLDTYLVLIPTNLLPEQIKSLSDVEKLGGKIVTVRASSLNYTLQGAAGDR